MECSHVPWWKNIKELNVEAAGNEELMLTWQGTGI